MNDLEFVGDYRQPQLSARQRALGHDGTSAGEFSFGDFLDIINPLQHIPVVSSLYREITGDEIGAPARVLGDTLFGGPLGFLSSVANVFYEEVAGEDVGETVIALFSGEEAEPDPQFAGTEDLVTPAAAAAAPAPLETAAGPAQAPTGAILPEAAPGMLTGQDALNALFRDLGSGEGGGNRSASAAPTPAMPLPDRGGEAQAMKSYPLPPRDSGDDPATPPAAAVAPVLAPTLVSPGPNGAGAATHPLLFAQEAGQGAIADRMMQALDKYQAMAQQNRRARDSAKGDEEQRDDRVTWQSDPTLGAGS